MLCALPGCKSPVFVEQRTGIVHRYCGRTHAIQAEGPIQPPHGSCQKCNLPECDETVAFDEKSGRVHDFCCKEHADLAIDEGMWNLPHRKSKYLRIPGMARCKYGGCTFPVYSDDSDKLYEFCGRSHAIAYKQQLQSAPVYSTGVIRVTQSASSNPGPASLSTGRSMNASSAVNASPAVMKPTVFAMSGFATVTSTFPNPGSSQGSGIATTSVSAPHPAQNPKAMASATPKLEPGSSHSSSSNNSSGAVSSQNSSSTMRQGLGQLSASASAVSSVSSEKPDSIPKCVICLVASANTIMIPCGHLCLCSEDCDSYFKSNRKHECPCCKQKVASQHRVFYS